MANIAMIFRSIYHFPLVVVIPLILNRISVTKVLP
jgi:hypothetical protein